jgi:tetratricopeptide (TPR) repeat protein
MPTPGYRLSALSLSTAVVAMIVSILLLPIVRADIVVLENGNEIQGEIVQEDRKFVTVRFSGGTLRLPRRDVKEIKRQKKLVFAIEEAEKALLRKDFSRAIELLVELRSADPESVKPRTMLLEAREQHARHLHDLHRYRDAITAYDEILREDPDNARGRNGRDAVLASEEEARVELASARSELESGSLETAIVRLERIYDHFPDTRDEVGRQLSLAYASRGRAAFESEEWRDAAEAFYRAATTDPQLAGDIEAPFVASLLRQIETLLPGGDFPGIEIVARRGLDVVPENAALNFYFGIAIEAAGKEPEARSLYEALIGEGPQPEVSISELRTRAESSVLQGLGASKSLHEEHAEEVLSGGFRALETPRFVVRHKNTRLGREVSFVAERFYASLFRALACTTHWKNPCEIVIYPNRAEYVAQAGIGSWSGGAHQLSSRRGVFSRHRITTWQGQERLTTGMIQHEIAHALLAHRLNYPESIPLWANEGFAVCQEPDYVRDHYRRLVRLEHRRGGLFPIATLVEADTYPDIGITLFYAQAHGIVEYLLSLRGVEVFAAFLKDVASGTTPVDAALRRHYRLAGRAALENRWHSYLSE